jgi:hypothetical protein
VNIPLAAIEDIIDASGVAPAIEDLLPHGARGRQLTARTLLTGMLLALADRRPAHLTEVRDTLTSLPAADQARLGVITDWKTGPHQLTYRQTEHTARLIARALAKDEPDGAPSPGLQAACDQPAPGKCTPDTADRTPGGHAADGRCPGRHRPAEKPARDVTASLPRGTRSMTGNSAQVAACRDAPRVSR